MSNGSSDKKKRKKKAPIRDVKMAQDNTRVKMKKVGKRNEREDILSAAESGVRHLKGILNKLEKNESFGEYKEPKTREERIELGKKMEKMNYRRPTRKRRK